jgi:hypothetical protein
MAGEVCKEDDAARTLCSWRQINRRAVPSQPLLRRNAPLYVPPVPFFSRRTPSSLVSKLSSVSMPRVPPCWLSVAVGGGGLEAVRSRRAAACFESLTAAAAKPFEQ